MKLFNKICIHDYHIVKTSNVLQLDDMGYPLMLCMIKCKKCGRTDQIWTDVPKSLLDDDYYKVLKWKHMKK